jgi:hypothetical protein
MKVNQLLHDSPLKGEKRIALNMLDITSDFVFARVEGINIRGNWIGARIPEGTLIEVTGEREDEMGEPVVVFSIVHGAADEEYCVHVNDFDDRFVKIEELEEKKRERKLKWFNDLQD